MHVCQLTLKRPLSISLITILALLMTGYAFGQASDDPNSLDQVEIRQGLSSTTKVTVWNPLQVRKLEGQVQSFDAKGLRIEVKNGEGQSEPKTIGSDQVQRIVPAWRGKGTAAAVSLFEQHKYQEFVKALSGLDLRSATIPPWQQVLIMSMLVQAQAAHNQIGNAGDTYIELAKYPIPDLVYGDMPLCWTVNSIDIAASAEKWIAQDGEVAQLLGASWLLLGSESQAAKRVLAELAKSKTPAIAQLAKAQAWRLVPVPETMAQLPSWLAERDRMLPSLALGPTEFLNDRLMRIGQSELAIGLAAQIAALYADRYPRARRALVSAAEMLKKQGRTVEAEKITLWIKQLDGAN